jgi:NAD-dependent deacetylase
MEIHGSIWRVRRADNRGASYEDRTVFNDAEMPLCNSTGHLLRPAVVWFGETLPQDELECIDRFLDNEAIELCLVIGTSALFSYIVNFAFVVNRQGGMVIEVNPEPSLPSGCVDIIVREKAGDFLPLLLAKE